MSSLRPCPTFHLPVAIASAFIVQHCSSCFNPPTSMMDGTHDSDSWEPVFQVVALADRVWNERFYSTLALSITSIFYTFAGSTRDVLLIAVILALLNRSIFLLYFNTIIQYIPLFGVCLVMTLGIHLATTSRKITTTSSWPGPGQPCLIPCRTTHRRLFPVKHSFSYSYLTVGIPVGYTGNPNGMISMDEPQRSIFPFTTLWSSWYRIDASDYLQRDSVGLSLRRKLDLFLQSEGVDPVVFPYAYLITAARFLGYHFNPVSFWYLYAPDKTLAAMVLEVNNTYDERRSYLVLRDPTNQSEGQQSRIKSTQKKDFHVSPFNSRNGHYSVMSSDPLGPGMKGFCGLDITITLNSSKGHPKLITRLYSEGEAIDPFVLSSLAKFKFVAKWFWVGFATMPRIVKEAVVLMYRRKLKLLDTPTPLTGTLGRHPTAAEKTVEICFGRYLGDLIHRCEKPKPRPITLKYSTSGLLSTAPTVLKSPGTTKPSEVLELRVLTPAFYSRITRYDDTLAGMKTELNEKKTIWVNNSELLAYLFTKNDMVIRPMSDSGALFAEWMDHLRGRHVSSMDKYVLSCETWALRKRYLWVLYRQWMVDYYFGGREDLLILTINVIRVGVAWVTALSLIKVITAIYD